MYLNYDNYTNDSYLMGKRNRATFSVSVMTEMFDKMLQKYSIYNKIQPKMKKIELPKLKKVELPKLKKIELPKLKKV
jgi:hypothetical protein